MFEKYIFRKFIIFNANAIKFNLRTTRKQKGLKSFSTKHRNLSILIFISFLLYRFTIGFFDVTEFLFGRLVQDYVKNNNVIVNITTMYPTTIIYLFKQLFVKFLTPGTLELVVVRPLFKENGIDHYFDSLYKSRQISPTSRVKTRFRHQFVIHKVNYNYASITSGTL